MTKLRIRCRVPAAERMGESSLLSERLADFSDAEIHAVGDDGTEVALTNVDEITFRVGSDSYPARAFVTFLQPEIDVEVEDERELLKGRIAGLEAQVAALKGPRCDARHDGHRCSWKAGHDPEPHLAFTLKGPICWNDRPPPKITIDFGEMRAAIDGLPVPPLPLDGEVGTPRGRS